MLPCGNRQFLKSSLLLQHFKGTVYTLENFPHSDNGDNFCDFLILCRNKLPFNEMQIPSDDLRNYQHTKALMVLLVYVNDMYKHKNSAEVDVAPEYG